MVTSRALVVRDNRSDDRHDSQDRDDRSDHSGGSDGSEHRHNSRSRRSSHSSKSRSRSGSQASDNSGDDQHHSRHKKQGTRSGDSDRPRKRNKEKRHSRRRRHSASSESSQHSSRHDGAPDVDEQHERDQHARQQYNQQQLMDATSSAIDPSELDLMSKIEQAKRDAADEEAQLLAQHPGLNQQGFASGSGVEADLALEQLSRPARQRLVNELKHELVLRAQHIQQQDEMAALLLGQKHGMEASAPALNFAFGVGRSQQGPVSQEHGHSHPGRRPHHHSARETRGPTVHSDSPSSARSASGHHTSEHRDQSVQYEATSEHAASHGSPHMASWPAGNSEHRARNSAREREAVQGSQQGRSPRSSTVAKQASVNRDRATSTTSLDLDSGFVIDEADRVMPDDEPAEQVSVEEEPQQPSSVALPASPQDLGADSPVLHQPLPSGRARVTTSRPSRGSRPSRDRGRSPSPVPANEPSGAASPSSGRHSRRRSGDSHRARHRDSPRSPERDQSPHRDRHSRSARRAASPVSSTGSRSRRSNHSRSSRSRADSTALIPRPDSAHMVVPHAPIPSTDGLMASISRNALDRPLITMLQAMVLSIFLLALLSWLHFYLSFMLTCRDPHSSLTFSEWVAYISGDYTSNPWNPACPNPFDAKQWFFS